MKKSTKKGFTLVELVIVIAIIAILAAVLIPTFSGIVEKANQSAALQALKNAYTEAMAEALSDGVIENNEEIYLAKDGTVLVKVGTKYYSTYIDDEDDTNDVEGTLEWTFTFAAGGSSADVTRANDTKYNYSIVAPNVPTVK